MLSPTFNNHCPLCQARIIPKESALWIFRGFKASQTTYAILKVASTAAFKEGELEGLDKYILFGQVRKVSIEQHTALGTVQYLDRPMLLLEECLEKLRNDRENTNLARDPRVQLEELLRQVRQTHDEVEQERATRRPALEHLSSPLGLFRVIIAAALTGVLVVYSNHREGGANSTWDLPLTVAIRRLSNKFFGFLCLFVAVMDPLRKVLKRVFSLFLLWMIVKLGLWLVVFGRGIGVWLIGVTRHRYRQAGEL